MIKKVLCFLIPENKTGHKVGFIYFTLVTKVVINIAQTAVTLLTLSTLVTDGFQKFNIVVKNQ